MPTIGMTVYGGVEHDARVRRAAAALVAAGYDVVIGSLADAAGIAPQEVAGARVIPVPSSSAAVRPGEPSPFRAEREPGRIRRVAARAGWLIGYAVGLRSWRSAGLARLPRADLWIGHDLFGVWAAAGLAKRDAAPLIYDSHELFLEAGTAARMPGPLRRLLAIVEGRLARRARAVITVNESIAAELASRYGVQPVVVLNVPGSWRAPTSDPFAAELGIADREVILYHGALSPNRGIEQLVEVARGAGPDRAVVILGDGPMSDDLETMSRAPELHGRLYVHPAVEIDDLPDWVGSASVGVIAFQATNRNNVLATPNKLFDYLVAGVPVVASDFPEMRRILLSIDGGLTCDGSDPAAIAASVDRILARPTDARAAERVRLATRARERFGWPLQAERLVSTVEAALGA